MARRLMRAFTLSRKNSEALDQLFEAPGDSPKRVVIERLVSKPEGEEAALSDTDGLSTEDYVALYARFQPVQRPTKFFTKVLEKLWDASNERKHDFKTFVRLARAQPEAASLLQDAYKRRTKRSTRTPQVNVSRIADVLLTLGLERLEERAANLDVKGSTRKDAGQSGHKLPITRRRKETPVRSV